MQVTSSLKRFFSFVALLVLSFVVAAPALADPGQSITDIITSGQIDLAIRLLNTRIQSSPNDAEAYHLLSKAYYHLNKWDQSIDYGEHAVTLAPNNSEYWMWLGRAYGEKADTSSFVAAYSLAKKVKASFEKSVELDGRNVAARTDLSEYYMEAPAVIGGGTDKALDQAKQISAVDPARAHWVYARLDEKKKDYGAAEGEYVQAIHLSNNYGSYWLNLANLYRQTDHWPQMESAIQRGVSSSNKSNAVYYNAATIYDHAGRNLPEAANLLRKYIAVGGSDEAPIFQAHYLLGTILQKQGDKHGAAAEYRIALNLAGDYAPASDALKKLGT
jgi:tetratricopeptide (TPR) repeat protein